MNDKRTRTTRRRDRVAADADAERLAERTRRRGAKRAATYQRRRTRLAAERKDQP